MRIILPIILIAAAGGLFALYTNGAYQHIKTLQTEVSAFDEALDNAKALKAERDDLLKKKRTFSTENEQKLQSALPDNVDNIRLIIDIQNIAARHNLSLKNIGLGTVSDARTARNALAVGSSGEPVGSVDVGFSVSASYEGFLAFLQDLEHSLRIVDVEKISFKTGVGDKYDFGLTIRTYWLH